MKASYTVTISSLNLSSSKGRYHVYHVNNYGQALGIIRMSLKTWGGFGDIIGYNTNGVLIKKYFVLRTEGIIETDEKSFKVLWDMAWGNETAIPDEVRPIVTYKVKEDPKKGLISRVLQKIRNLIK